MEHRDGVIRKRGRSGRAALFRVRRRLTTFEGDLKMTELPWEQPFLAALSRLGVVAQAAAVAGIGRSTANGRRKSNPEFARRWDEALPPRDQRRKAIALAKQAGAGGPPSNWRALFLEALAQTSNVRASAERAKVPTATVYKTRRESAEFALKWRAALREGYDNLEMELLGHLRDPQPERKMDIAAAVRLLAAHRATVERERALAEEEDEQAVLESIDAFLEGMRQRRIANEKLLREAKNDNDAG
jgi:hypothetical protein